MCKWWMEIELYKQYKTFPVFAQPGKGWEYSRQMRDKVEGLHNCREFPQALSVILGYVNTGETFSIAFVN